MAITNADTITTYATKYGFGVEEGMSISIYRANPVEQGQDTLTFLVGETEEAVRFYSTRFGTGAEVVLIGNHALTAEAATIYTEQGE